MCYGVSWIRTELEKQKPVNPETGLVYQWPTDSKKLHREPHNGCIHVGLLLNSTHGCPDGCLNIKSEAGFGVNTSVERAVGAETKAPWK